MQSNGTLTEGAARTTGPAAEPCAPRRGRPRSEAAEQAIFAAVEQQLESGVSLTELSIERIAAVAGVGKATIYRRWPNKEALLVDVIARLEEPPPQSLPGGSTRDNLIRMVDFLRRRGLHKRSRWVVASAMGQLNAWPELRTAYQDRIVRPRRDLARALVEDGIRCGELRADLDVDLMCDLLIGPILLRAVMRDDAPLDDPRLAEQMVDAALDGLAARSPGGAPH